MTQLDIHPEHLIDRVLRGTASDAERGELLAHVRACAVCAVERELARALREPLAGPIETTSAVVDAALSELIEAGRLVPTPLLPTGEAPRSAQHARAWLPWAVAACLFFTGSAAAATLIMAVRGSAPSPAPSASTAADDASRTRHRARTDNRRAPIAADDEAQPEPVSATAPTPEPSAAAPAPVAPRTRHAQSAANGAAELFAKARALAMDAQFTEAVALYATLQKRFPASPQAQVSHVVLGRLFLEHLADPRAALTQFDAYLLLGGPNRPEALLGRARALRALGRVQDEVQALRTLVDDYPESLYVAPAEERLRAVK